MNFVDFLIFLLASCGATAGIVGSSLLEPVRSFIFSKSEFLKELLSCPMCTGLWVGLFFSLFFEISPVYAGFIASVASWSLYSFVDMTNTITYYFETLIDGQELEQDE